MEALKGRGTTDRDQDGLISVSEVNRYVYEQTRRWAARSGLKQRPKFVAAVQGEIILVEKMSPSDEVKLRLNRPSVTQWTRPVVPIQPAQPSSTQPSSSTLASEMVLIPAGSFQMGSNDGKNDEKPVHTIYVDAFYMDKYEVTNAQYRKFMSATGHRKPDYWNDSRFNKSNQPVVGVTWHDATAYARWAGKRLPTEAEWEKAARGGLEGKKYPWGDTIDSSRACYDQDYLTGKPVSVGSYSANGYGLYDMAGNVYEWCADWYVSDYYSFLPSRNTQGPSSGSYRVLRGGSWFDVTFYLRAASRYNLFPAGTIFYDGFRCVSGFPAA